MIEKMKTLIVLFLFFLSPFLLFAEEKPLLTSLTLITNEENSIRARDGLLGYVYWNEAPFSKEELLRFVRGCVRLFSIYNMAGGKVRFIGVAKRVGEKPVMSCMTDVLPTKKLGEIVCKEHGLELVKIIGFRVECQLKLD